MGDREVLDTEIPGQVRMNALVRGKPIPKPSVCVITYNHELCIAVNRPGFVGGGVQ